MEVHRETTTVSRTHLSAIPSTATPARCAVTGATRLLGVVVLVVARHPVDSQRAYAMQPLLPRC
jgi:hypothetical protein